jgi:hypothetical protein
LPSGGRAVSSPQDAVLFTAYVDRIAEAMKIGRHQIRERAFKDYSTDRIASGIVAKLHDVQGRRNYPSTTTRESGSAGLSLV